MADAIQRPQDLRINAWTGARSPQEPLPPHTPWAQMENLASRTKWLGPPLPIDYRDWTHPDVGWGLILPDRDDLPVAERAKGEDAPVPIRRLLQHRRNAPVLRWRKELQQGHLRRYYADGIAPQDLSAQAPNPGIGRGRIPVYLLIYASPVEIPWAVQYALNMSTFVGRLDLAGPGLNHYVDALIDDWKGQVCDPRAPLVWSVDHGQNDITWLMARAVAGKLWEKFENNKDLNKRRLLKDASATREELAAALAERSPALVVTTSHGMTGPLNDKNALRAQLGAPVDVQHAVLRARQLDGWQPSGAIWYAHACCSAGSDAVSRYKGLLSEDGTIGSLLNQVAAAGPTIAPLARVLLGTEKPLRAFIGHVEPTFDWTLRDPANKQVLYRAFLSRP